MGKHLLKPMMIDNMTPAKQCTKSVPPISFDTSQLSENTEESIRVLLSKMQIRKLTGYENICSLAVEMQLGFATTNMTPTGKISGFLIPQLVVHFDSESLLKLVESQIVNKWREGGLGDFGKVTSIRVKSCQHLIHEKNIYKQWTKSFMQARKHTETYL